jgi:uracil-DNA glycosylase
VEPLAVARAQEGLAALEAEVTACRACPRLVAWRERVAVEKRAAFRDDEYWARPVPGFGDPAARVCLVGLAPAAHGANRTGRMFTGDRSGEFLYAALWRTGFANRPESTWRDDGLRLDGAWITAPVRCAPPANKPTPDERDRCRPFMERELDLLPGVRVFVALGLFGYQALCGVLGVAPRPAFGHGAEVDLGGRAIVCSYHVSQQNTFTGRLTPDMFDAVLLRARELAGLGPPGVPAERARGPVAR